MTVAPPAAFRAKSAKRRYVRHGRGILGVPTISQARYAPYTLVMHRLPHAFDRLSGFRPPDGNRQTNHEPDHAPPGGRGPLTRG